MHPQRAHSLSSAAFQALRYDFANSPVLAVK